MQREPRYWAGIIAIVVCAIVPVAAAAAAFAMLPDTVIPLHFDAHGTIDRWGSKDEISFLPLSGLFALVYAIMLVFYMKADVLAQRGLMHIPGPDKGRNGRIVVVACCVICDVVLLCAIFAGTATIMNAV